MPVAIVQATAVEGICVRQPVDHKGIISIDPARRFGKPCIRNTRITVFDVVRYLASGMTEDELLNDFPDLTEEDILACYSYLSDEEMVPRRPPGSMSRCPGQAGNRDQGST